MGIQVLSNNKVTNWKEYGKVVRKAGCDLLRRLDEFPNSILVGGCQRSGTTMTGEVINQSAELVQYAFGREISLDAALILGGYVEHTPSGRYCFQTTWLNQCYQEYTNYHNGHKIIWVIRNPLSVIRSMLYNWPVGALDELFRHCGMNALPEHLRRQVSFYSWPLMSRVQRFYFSYEGKGARFFQRERFHQDQMMTLDFDEARIFVGVDKLLRACYSYNGKASQLFDLRKTLGPDKMMVVDYDDLVGNKDTLLPRMFDYLDLSYKPEFAGMIHSQSLKKKETLSEFEVNTIKEMCDSIYMQTREHITLK